MVVPRHNCGSSNNICVEMRAFETIDRNVICARAKVDFKMFCCAGNNFKWAIIRWL